MMLADLTDRKDMGLLHVWASIRAFGCVAVLSGKAPE